MRKVDNEIKDCGARENKVQITFFIYKLHELW